MSGECVYAREDHVKQKQKENLRQLHQTKPTHNESVEGNSKRGRATGCRGLSNLTTQSPSVLSYSRQSQIGGGRHTQQLTHGQKDTPIHGHHKTIQPFWSPWMESCIALLQETPFFCWDISMHTWANIGDTWRGMIGNNSLLDLNLNGAMLLYSCVRHWPQQTPVWA